ncbi:hypothetical protein [Tardiphaga sp.]|uniref:hypothetical protein n=1 Tax=Tardiphaga sp. TaxID=1926292 RepID=UPI0026348097|nr:hypothetical protein [Tardiphaga sp.]MDB5617083.1 hypothetical protein [Tardiphaga sp.]
MKRILIFLLLGPVVGFLVFLLLQVFAGKDVGGAQGFLLGLPFAFIFAVLPSLAMGFEDRWLEDKISLWPKVLATAAVGYGGSVAMMAVWTAMPITLPQLLMFGIVGAVQGAVCSWLAGGTYDAKAK